MRPTKLVARGLKRWEDRTLELGPLTILQGPNGSGKTALLQAVRLTILGYDPETGKRLQETRKLLRPGSAYIETGMSFDNGFGIVRKFGEKSETLVVPPRGESSGRAAQARIDEETGGEVVTLDLSQLLELSDEKRREWLFQHLPADEAALDWDTFAQWTDAEESSLTDVVRRLWSQNVQTAPNPVVGLGSAIEVARRDFLAADRERQTQAKVVARGEERLRLHEEPATVAPGALQELERRRDTLIQRIGEARAGKDAREEEAREGRRAREVLDERLEKAREGQARAEAEREHHERVRADLLEQITGFPEIPSTLDLEARVGPLQEHVDRTARAHLATLEPMTTAQRAEAQAQGRRAAVADLEGACPFAELGCETDTSEMVAGRLQELDAELEELAAAARTAERENAAAAAEKQGAVDELNRVNSELAGIQAKRKELGELEKSAAHELTLAKELGERAGLHAVTAAECEAQLAELPAVDAPQEGDGLQDLYDERDKLTEAITALQGQLEEVRAHEQRLEAHAEEERELERLAKRAADLQELDGNLRRLRAHVIRKMITPLASHARDILRAMDHRKLFRFEFERENRAVMDFGFEEAGTFRSYDAASNGERAMLTVAFVGALLAVLEPPMRLLIVDNVEQLDDGRRLNLLSGLAALQDRFDSVIVAGACDLSGVHEWDLVDLEEEAAAVA